MYTNSSTNNECDKASPGKRVRIMNLGSAKYNLTPECVWGVRGRLKILTAAVEVAK